MLFRCAAGYESPETALDLLQDGCYQPYFCADVWALGQLMLEATGGAQPKAQVKLQKSQQYIEEVTNGIMDLSKASGRRKHMQYLNDLLADQSKIDCADQVRFFGSRCLDVSLMRHIW